MRPDGRCWGWRRAESSPRPPWGIDSGVISILDHAIPRHLRYYDSLGIGSRLAGDRAVGIGVTGLADESHTVERMTTTGRALRDEDGADVLVLGCAGMARYRDRIENSLGIPVVDPTLAAAGMAISLLSPRGSGG